MNPIIADYLLREHITSLRTQAERDHLLAEARGGVPGLYERAVAQVGDALVAAGNRLREHRRRARLAPATPKTDGMQMQAHGGIPLVSISHIEYRPGDAPSVVFWQVSAPIDSAAPRAPLVRMSSDSEAVGLSRHYSNGRSAG